MRLINVNTLEFHEFYGSQLEGVSYAILSHTWHDEEVSYQEMKNERRHAQSKDGYTKILFTVTQAKKDQLNWVWIDTCCIDKTSSADLTEAINSMYRWYERSVVCYAYLQDVDSSPLVEDDDTQFKRSRWLTRGWTLQELIAPERVIFYSKDWEQIGEKLAVLSSTRTVSQIWGERGKNALCVATGIPHGLLFGARSKDHYSVAQRMSWASRRVCTRIEDTAYCLLGLFDINMPLLYGEEERAFTRLQEEIIRTMDDHSIYAWTIPKDYYWYHTTHGSTIAQHNNIAWSFHPMLASSPRLFQHGRHVVCSDPESHEPSGLTKHGVRIQLNLKPHRFPVSGHILGLSNRKAFFAVLNCRHEYYPKRRIAVLLVMAPSTTKYQGNDPGISHFYRVATLDNSEVDLSEDKSAIKELIYIKQKLPESDIAATRSKFIFRFSGIPVHVSMTGDYQKDDIMIGVIGYRVTAADPQTLRDWSYTLNCLGSSPALGELDRPRAFVIARRHTRRYEAITLVCQVATLGITASSTAAAATDNQPRPPSPVLLSSVTELESGANHQLVAQQACESALMSPGWNSHTYTKFPCRLPEIRLVTGVTVEIGVSIVEVEPPKDESWDSGRRFAFIFTVLNTSESRWRQ